MSNEIDNAVLPVEYAKSLLLVINALEVLPIMTGGIIHDINEGEPYEKLVRRLKVLCEEVDLLALRARNVKVSLLPDSVP